MLIVVVGSGFGGLAAAVRLQAQGHDVTLLDKRDKPGGRAYVYEQDGFTFEAGPTVITAPWMIRELFALADGGHFDHSGETARMVAQVTALSPGDVAGYLKFVRRSERIFAKGFVELADRPFLRPWDMVKIIPDMLRLQSYRSVYGFVSSFVRDPRLRQVLSFHPLLVGGNPFQTTSIYTLIHYLERQWGVWFALGVVRPGWDRRRRGHTVTALRRTGRDAAPERGGGAHHPGAGPCQRRATPRRHHDPRRRRG